MAIALDWTVDPATHRSNSSERFLQMEAAVEELINSETHHLLQPSRVRGMAGLIMAQLAHVHHLAPTAAPGKRKAFERLGEDHYLVLVESEKMPDGIWIHKCGTPVQAYTTREPIWYPEFGPGSTVGGGEVRTLTRPYCLNCEEL